MPWSVIRDAALQYLLPPDVRMESSVLIGIILALTGIVVCFRVSKRKVEGLLPPGPKGIPLLGNYFDMPKENQWITFQFWSREYNSDLIYLNVLGAPIIVVNSSQAALDLLERRSSLYSDRAQTPMANELAGFDWLISFMEYGNSWRERRRMFHQCFHSNAISNYNAKMVKGTTDLLRRLLDSPEPADVTQHLRLMAGAIILDIMYGFDIKDMYDRYITSAETALHALAMVGNAGSYVVDTIPILKYIPSWFPGANFKRDAAVWKKATTAMVEEPFNAVNSAVTSGSVVQPSVMASLLEDVYNEGRNPHREKIIKDASAAVYAGGADTTVSSLGSFLLAMLLYPDVQRKAQAEIDKVVGRSRLPDFTDKPSLPYVTAVLNEVLRWHPVVPLAIPHRVTRDDIYKGLRIPKGSLIVGNAWAILHDEHVYPNPDEFNPNRFLTSDGQLNTTLVKEAQLEAFGFGRRICPGRYFAVASIWINIASLLATFDILKPKDSDGKPIEPSGEYSSGMLVYPKAFKCLFKPRSEDMAALVRSLVGGTDV